MKSSEPQHLYRSRITGRRRISDRAFEMLFERPADFNFRPGQRIRLAHGGIERDYSLISAPEDPELAVCIRLVENGALSPLLSAAALGTRIDLSGPDGYFVLLPSPRKRVFIATGTGIAPFVSMVRAGAAGFILLHGVRSAADLYYRKLLRKASASYVPCLSGGPDPPPDLPSAFRGRVTEYLSEVLPAGAYDFYICGRGDMIREATWRIDDRHPGGLVFTEMFF
jgi:benzoate/toluate 1,2-dioxygenase reductase component